MRRHFFATIVLFFLAIIESSVLPVALGTLPRPNLVLIFVSTWAALRGNEGFVWAMGGGILLDLFSSTPFGTHCAGLIAGNLVAFAFDRIPIPAAFFRVTNWVAIATFIFHSVMLFILTFAGRPFNIPLGFTTVMLPLLAINPTLSLFAYLLLNPFAQRLREQERFAT
jgi:rod shape-determining protein MreD